MSSSSQKPFTTSDQLYFRLLYADVLDSRASTYDNFDNTAAEAWEKQIDQKDVATIDPSAAQNSMTYPTDPHISTSTSSQRILAPKNGHEAARITASASGKQASPPSDISTIFPQMGRLSHGHVEAVNVFKASSWPKVILFRHRDTPKGHAKVGLDYSYFEMHSPDIQALVYAICPEELLDSASAVSITWFDSRRGLYGSVDSVFLAQIKNMQDFIVEFDWDASNRLTIKLEW